MNTKKFKTSGGTEIEMKTFISGRESREIQNVFLSEMKLSVDKDGQPNIDNITGDIANKAQDKTIELLVVSVNGKTENVLDLVLDLPKEEFDEVVEEFNKISQGMDKKKEKK